jgi:hypothetical protein
MNVGGIKVAVLGRDAIARVYWAHPGDPGSAGLDRAKFLADIRAAKKAGADLVILHEPADFRSVLEPVPDGVVITTALPPNGAGGGDTARRVVVAFFTERDRLAGEVAAFRTAIFPAGGLWLAWPKKASGVATDLTGDVVRELGLAAGIVDIKVCAISDIWSGLRFAIRVSDR